MMLNGENVTAQVIFPTTRLLHRNERARQRRGPSLGFFARGPVFGIHPSVLSTSIGVCRTLSLFLCCEFCLRGARAFRRGSARRPEVVVDRTWRRLFGHGWWWRCRKAGPRCPRVPSHSTRSRFHLERPLRTMPVTTTTTPGVSFTFRLNGRHPGDAENLPFPFIPAERAPSQTAHASMVSKMT